MGAPGAIGPVRVGSHLEPPSAIQPRAHPPSQSQPAGLLRSVRSALSPGPVVAGRALAGSARHFAGTGTTPARAGIALLGGSGWSGESLLRSFGGPGTGGDDGQAPGQPLPAGAAVSGLAEDQAAPDSGDQRQRNRKGPATGERWRNGGQIRGTSSITGTNRNRVISELVLTAVTKFLVSFGELVDRERKLATMECVAHRESTCGRNSAEETGDLTGPGHSGEFINRGYQKNRGSERKR